MELEYRIGATWEKGDGNETFADTSPSDTRNVLAYYRLMTADQVGCAMDAATSAFPRWRALSPIARAAILRAAADLLRRRIDMVSISISEENGKLLKEARAEVEKSADVLDFYAATARLPTGAVIADVRPGTSAMTLIEPLGVVVLMTPWNDPILTPARKLGPALIAGNTVVLKPARETPLAALHLVRALIDAGLPAGVLGTVLCEHSVFDEAVLGRSELAAVSFTGSTGVGVALSKKLSGRNVRLQTEMGGKNGSIVLADADLNLAATTVLAASFGQAGQRCTATSRVIVAAPVFDRFLELLVSGANAITPGPSLLPSSQLGPLVSRHHQTGVLSHISGARASGARVVCGGGIPNGKRLAHGCFVQPTIVTEVTRETPLWRDEVFGPVLAVQAVAGFDDAVDAVNDSSYGLSAALFTADLKSVHRFISAVDAGQIAINLPTYGWDVHQPFGGFKDSGSPFKEQGLEGLRFYTRTKMAAIRSDW